MNALENDFAARGPATGKHGVYHTYNALCGYKNCRLMAHQNPACYLSVRQTASAHASPHYLFRTMSAVPRSLALQVDDKDCKVTGSAQGSRAAYQSSSKCDTTPGAWHAEASLISQGIKSRAPSPPSAAQMLSWQQIYEEAGITRNTDNMEIESISDFLAREEFKVPLSTNGGWQGAAIADEPAPATARNGEYSALFHYACTKRGKTPVVTFERVAEQRFIAIIAVDGVELTKSGPQPSKKQAKEEGCKLAQPHLESKFPILTQVSKQPNANNEGLGRADPEVLAENWIGLLVGAFRVARVAKQDR